MEASVGLAARDLDDVTFLPDRHVS